MAIGKKMTLMGRIRLARLKRGWSKRELAERAGMSNAYVSLLEAGAWQTPTLASVNKLATALGVTQQWLVFGEGPVPVWKKEPSLPRGVRRLRAAGAA
jgi:transcriptional regulator with XRE-family HTH domain